MRLITFFVIRLRRDCAISPDFPRYHGVGGVRPASGLRNTQRNKPGPRVAPAPAGRQRPPGSLPGRVAEIESLPRSRPAPAGRGGSPAASPQQTPRSQPARVVEIDAPYGGGLRSLRPCRRQTPRFPPARAAAKFSRDFQLGGGGVCRRPPAADQPHASPARIPAGFWETGRPTNQLRGSSLRPPHRPRPTASQLSRVFEPPTTAAGARGGRSCAPGACLTKTTVAALRAPPQVLRRGVGRPELLRPRPRPRSGHRVCAAPILLGFLSGRRSEVNLRARATAL